jgi:cytochrome P450
MSEDIPLDQRISDDDLLFQISTFLFAGSDTTSLALTWALFLLSKPENLPLQDRLREELGQLDTSLPHLDFFSELDALPYLDNVVKEVLRLVPPVHSTIRVATADDLLPTSNPIQMTDGTAASMIPVAKGTMVHVAIEGFSLNREVWGPDAWQFK